jgi:hypothetical protein
MTDDEIRSYLEDNGYPAHIVKAGRDGLIRRWTQFVDEVGRGYEFGLEDYRNDLDVRGIVELIGAGSEPEVAEADAKLKSMLTGTDHRIWESSAENPWWDFGYPANAAGDLRSDLQASGLLL